MLQGRIDGIDAAEKIRKKIDVPVIYLTAYSDEKTLQRAKITEPFGTSSNRLNQGSYTRLLKWLFTGTGWK